MAMPTMNATVTRKANSATGNMLPYINTVQLMLVEIIQIGKYNVSKIATECQISSRIIRNLLLGYSNVVHAVVFEKILYLYCFACFDERGHKISNHTSRDPRASN